MQELRQLGDEAFLGGKRRPGALPIYDLEGSLGGDFLRENVELRKETPPKFNSSTLKNGGWKEDDPASYWVLVAF